MPPISKEEFERLYSMVSSTSERTVKMETLLEVQATQIKEIKDDIEIIKEEDNQQNVLLAEHIAGVKTQAKRLDNEIEARKAFQVAHIKDNQETVKQLDQRIASSERIWGWFKLTAKIFGGIGAVGAGISVIYYGLTFFKILS